ncbi:MAG: YkgJ family cysteine cluster protein [Bdellovibrionales bacterium]|nr:YkgJ family cysteine cluster protein [Bdellovibrionales bacterium]
MSKFDSKFFDKPFRFECQGSGKCCVSRGEYGHVYLTLQDRKDMAKAMGIPTASFTKTHCTNDDGVYRLKDNADGPECRFLNSKKQCDVYEGRPTQCRTWPFWPENMNAKTWTKEIATFCPGVGKGRVVPKESVKTQILEQHESELEIFDPEKFFVADAITEDQVKELLKSK